MTKLVLQAMLTVLVIAQFSSSRACSSEVIGGPALSPVRELDWLIEQFELEPSPSVQPSTLTVFVSESASPKVLVNSVTAWSVNVARATSPEEKPVAVTSRISPRQSSSQTCQVVSNAPFWSAMTSQGS